MEDERWLPIKDFPGYEVSNRGSVRSQKLKGFFLMQPWKSWDGYNRVELVRNSKRHSKRIHRLVLETFVGDCPDGHQANHKDGQKRNNYVENLEWITPSQNLLHAYANGLKSNAGELNPLSILNAGEVWLIRKLLFLEVRKVVICKMFKIKFDHLYNINVGKIWKGVTYRSTTEDLEILRKKNYDRSIFY